MKLSVVINNYNYGRFLTDAIDSALAQLEPDDELVLAAGPMLRRLAAMLPPSPVNG